MMEMDFMQEFTRAWQIEFPNHPHPDQDRLSACLLPNSMTSSVSSASSITSASEARLAEIEVLCAEFTSKAERLEMEARQQRFVANFLDRILLKLLRDSRSVDSTSSVDSPVATQAPMLRGTKYSLVSPMVPRGTLHKVKDALRSSGMLLDTSDEEEGIDREEEEDDEEEQRGLVKLKRRAAYVGSRGRIKSIPPAPASPPPQPCYQTPHGDGDCDSLDDYLYDSLSESDGDPVMAREKPPSNAATTLEPPTTAQRPAADDVTIRQRSDVYVSVEEIKRKKRDSRHAVNSGMPTSPAGNPPRTLHERLSLMDGWRGDTSLPLYEQLEDMTSSPDATDVCQRRAHEKIEEENRRGHFNIDDEIEEDPYDMALLAERREDEEGVEDQPPQTIDRSNLGVQRRLASSKPRYSVLGKGKHDHQRVLHMPWQFDHTLMLKEAEGDIRRQELIHILKSEEMHLQVLEIMSGCRRIFLAYNVSEQKTSVIFNQVSELREIQEQFVTEMAKRLNNWKSNSTIADVLSRLDNYKALKDYITNLPNAVKVYEEVINDRREFAELLEVINMEGRSIMFRDLLQQPVMWLTKNAENIKRMIAHTPEDHPDHTPLESILNHLLGMVKSGTFGRNEKERAISMYGGLGMSESGIRNLDRHSLLVELGSNGSTRKLRHVFLFTDMLVCAKPRAPASVGTSFEIRWVIPISQIVIYRANDPQSDEMKSKRRAELETLKHRIKDIRKDIKKEMEKDGLRFEVPNMKQRLAVLGEGYQPRYQHQKLKHVKSNSEKSPLSRSSFRRWNWAPGRRGIDKLKEQLHKTQAQLVLLSPNLEFKISSGNEKRHTLLMSSEYEKRSWTDAINALKNASEKSTMSSAPSFSDVQVLLEDYKDMVSVNKLGSCLLHDGQEGVISGILKVTIHRVEGLKEPINCVVSVEVDSFEHFDLFAKTTPVGPSCDPEVNQEFDIELDFSTTVRFIVCDESVDGEGRTTQQNIAKLELRLDVDSLSHYVETPHGLATFSDPSHSILLTLSLAYRATHETLARQLSERRGGLFGIPLEKVVRREVLRAPRGGAGPPPQVPLIIRACTDELDRRALEEPGIYRISGMSADVAKLKGSFDSNVTATSKLLEGYEVHVISGVLKAYLRELPEPLFTVERYREFMEAFDLSPIESKREEFLRLMNSLPEPNISTTRHLLRHFARINRKSDINKMVAGNLGLIFGPTLLSPASAVLPCDILSVTMESFKQSGALTFMIALTTEGRIFAD